MIDLHSHILPCIDDGAKSFGESAKLINMESNDGVKTIALTPHFLCEHIKVDEFIKKRNSIYDKLKIYIRDSKVDMNFTMGAEVKLSMDLFKQENIKSLCYSNTNFMLVELPIYYYGDWIPNALYELRLMEIVPIVAHIERYLYFKERLDLLYDIISSGAIGQVNASNFLDKKYQTRKYINILMKHNFIHIISTDSHSIEHRPPLLKAAMSNISKNYGKEKMKYLIKNSESIVSNVIPDTLQPVPYTKRKRLF